MDGAGGNPGNGGFDPCECIVRTFSVLIFSINVLI